MKISNIKLIEILARLSLPDEHVACVEIVTANGRSFLATNFLRVSQDDQLVHGADQNVLWTLSFHEVSGLMIEFAEHVTPPRSVRDYVQRRERHTEHFELNFPR